MKNDIEQREEPQTWLGKWAKHLIENEGVEVEDDIDDEQETSE